MGDAQGDFYPTLSEEGKQEAQALVDGFKRALAKALDEALATLYTDVIIHIESSSWCNYRNAMIDAFRGYNTKDHEHDFRAIRKAMLDLHHDEIIKDLNQDLVEENKDIKRTIELLKDSRERY